TQSKELGSAFNDLREICQGEVAVAIGDPSSLLNQSNAMEVPVAVLADVGSKKEKAAEFLKKQVERLTTQGKLRKTEAEFRGERIILLEKEESDSKEKGPKAICLSLADDLLALTLSKPYLQDILANRKESEGKSLSQHPDYKPLREKYGKDAAAFLYVHLGRW